MTRRMRLPTERELKAIKDNGLHEAIVDDLESEIERALGALERAIPSDRPTLDIVIGTLAELLRAQDRIRSLVDEILELGGTRLGESQIYAAMAVWIIDNQLGGGPEWDPTTPPRRH